MAKILKVSRQQVLDELWNRGELKWLLYPHQRPIYEKIREVIASDDPTKNSYIIDCARQFGKSFIMFLIAVEECLRRPKQTVAYVGPLKSQVNEIINGHTFGVLFKTCPNNLIPKHDGSTLEFYNGSRIRLAGTDNKNYLNLRGGAANLVLLDEAGFMAELEIGVLPTVEPLTKTTGGKVIYASTPPDTLDHDYIEILRFHDESGLISTYTIYDDKSLSPIQLEKIIQQCKGINTTKFKREYLCQRVVESSIQVIPEISDVIALGKESQFFINDDYKNDEFLRYYHKYVVIDTGVRDKTGVIFAHYNYRAKKVIVEHCFDLQGKDYNTAKLSELVKTTVSNLWPDLTNCNIQYIADSNNLVVINDLNAIYHLPFVGTTKGRLDEMTGKVRDWVYDNRILFAPAAMEAYNCTKFAVWAKSRTEFARSAKYGHYDLTASLVYLIRNIDDLSDPIPRFYGLDPYTQFIPPNYNVDRGQMANLNQIFNPRRNRSYR